ncbi:NepR family anti-sigma factor [Roseibium sp. FZY0029]|uniref:NepR family anti-sigma factor n=1 Tax=Roseibium sp. FZY0029 TaxID=3116647 RepID=UPI002ECE97EC|nr:NepR family anti-sigma factor [Roseibium sp. FZY0029]
MASKLNPEMPNAGFGVITPSAGSKSKEDWIGNQLKKVYDEALSEDIPDDMMDLLSALDVRGSDEEAAE